MAGVSDSFTHPEMFTPKNATPRDEIFKALDSERGYALRKWGYRQADGTFKDAPHGVGDFITYMRHYLTEADKEASLKAGNTPALEVLRKVVNLGIACFEQNGLPFRDLSQPIINQRDGQPA